MIDRREFQMRARIETETLQAWIEASWLIPGQGKAASSFSEADLARAALIRDLKDDLGFNDEGVAVRAVRSSLQRVAVRLRVPGPRRSASHPASPSGRARPVCRLSGYPRSPA